VFGSVLANLKGLEFFVVFLSTSSKLSILAPPKPMARSHRPRDNPNIILPAPFTELAFDVFAEGGLVEDEFDASIATDFKFLMNFGRPM
jgi:hypothetical protein